MLSSTSLSSSIMTTNLPAKGWIMARSGCGISAGSTRAGARGTVAEILLADAQPAEQDAALMWIREDS